jgi:hypothetical protein
VFLLISCSNYLNTSDSWAFTGLTTFK